MKTKIKTEIHAIYMDDPTPHYFAMVRDGSVDENGNEIQKIADEYFQVEPGKPILGTSYSVLTGLIRWRRGKTAAVKSIRLGHYKTPAPIGNATRRRGERPLGYLRFVSSNSLTSWQKSQEKQNDKAAS